MPLRVLESIPHDRRAAGLEHLYNSDAPTSPSNVNAPHDPWQTQGTIQRGLHQGPILLQGRIVDSISHANSYKVQCDRAFGTLQCCDASHGSLGLIGARPVHTYPIGARVIVYYHPQEVFGVVLCAIPDWFFDVRHKLADFIVQGSNVGILTDVVHRAPMQLRGNEVIDFSANRPLDSLQLGEWGAFSETGVRILLDSFMAQFGVDESTMVSAFYFDQLLRVAGHNLQIWSAGHLAESTDDEGETSAFEGYSPYPWETAGAVNPSAVPFVETDPDAITGTRTRIEPIHDDLLPVHRDVDYRGYLGQGGKRMVQGPITGVDFSRRSDDGVTLNGFFDEIRTLAGDYGVRAARSLTIAKQPAIPAPRRRKLVEDPAGDSAEGANYLSAGLYGSAPLDPHNVVDLRNANPDGAASEVAAILDHVAYLFNWQGLHAFHYHERDWYTPDESELVEEASPMFSALITSHFMLDPPSFEVHVDDRYGLAKYFNSRASITLTPRGGISIVDGFGSEISMAGGHIFEYAPGDITRASGRTIHDRAGWDGIYLANNCLDVAANLGSVSIKGDANVMITGGNNRCGGVLIQSLSNDIAFDASTTGSPVVGGIVLRAMNSAVNVLAGNVLIATNAWGDSLAGRIILDCGAYADSGSESSILLRANQVVSHASSCVVDVVGEGSNKAINEVWKSHTIVSNKLVSRAETYLWNCATVHGNLGVTGTVVCPLDNDSGLTAANDAITTRDESGNAAESATEVGHIVSSSPIEDVEFSFRSATVLQTDDFVIYEPVWHQMYRLGNDPLIIDYWTDSIYTDDNGNESQPYPGKEIWSDQARYGLVSLNLFDPFTGMAVDRTTENYENAELGTITYVTLDTNWPVIRNP